MGNPDLIIKKKKDDKTTSHRVSHWWSAGCLPPTLMI
jgi:hypothetical protein